MHSNTWKWDTSGQIDPEKRITVAEALAHPWVKEGGTAEDKNLNLSLKAGLRAYIRVWPSPRPDPKAGLRVHIYTAWVSI
jgi:hypothetical protein